MRLFDKAACSVELATMARSSSEEICRAGNRRRARPSFVNL
jgi:hypothetical protein